MIEAILQIPPPCLGGAPGMLVISLQPPHVCEAYTPPPSHCLFGGPHTESLSWHHSHTCCRMSFPCASAGPTRRCLCSHPVCGPICPQRLAKMWGCILASSYCSRKASTSKHQRVYVTSTPGSVNLKIGISNLVGASHFLSLLPLWPLCLHQWPTVSLSVEYLSQSGAPLSGEEVGKPPPPTVVHWDFRGLPRGHAALVRGVSLASVISPTPEALLAC